MKKLCDFPTCDFDVFTESKTEKTFFTLSRGPKTCCQSVKNLCENGIGKCDAKSSGKCIQNDAKNFPKHLKESKGGQRVRQEAPKVAQVAKGVSKKPSASLLLANIPPKSLLERSQASFCFILEGF